MNLRDAELTVTKPLPATATTIFSDGIDLGLGANADFLARCELVVEAPALAVGELANAETVTYKVQTDADPAFGSPTDILPAVIVQTGAAGAGAAAAEKRLRLPLNVERYIRCAATHTAADDASAKSLTMGLRF
jgi:hypothetical protein